MIKKKNAETKFGHVDHTKISLDKKYKMETTPFIPPGLTKNEIIKPITKPAKSAIQSCPVPNKKLKSN